MPNPEPNPRGSAPPGSLPPKWPPPRPRRSPAGRLIFVLVAVFVVVAIWLRQQSSRTPRRNAWTQEQRQRFPGQPQMPQNDRFANRVQRPPKKRPAEPTGPRAAAPRFAKPGGVFTERVSVELSAPSANARIRYTLDGSEPGEGSREYNGPLSVAETTLVLAKAFEPGLAPSPTVAQTYTMVDGSLADFTSNLPLVIINSFGQPISKQNAVPASLRIIGTGAQRSSLTGESDYDGRCEIKLRGFSSLRLPKKSYTVKTRDDSGGPRKAPILGLPQESDWVLYAPYSDKTLMRDVLAYELSNKMGHYAARTRFVEVFLARRGAKLSKRDYLGLYVFEEKIKRSKERVNIKKLTPEDNAEPEVSGGYIIKRDHFGQPGGEGGPFGFFNPGGQNVSSDGETGFRTGRGMHLFYVEPKEREITSAQKAYLSKYMNQLERALYGSSFRNPAEGYAKYLDVDSFIDQFWIIELSKNIDGFRYSCFMTKDREGKLRVEPIWDWNLSFGNANYHQGWMTQGWYWTLIRENEVSWFRRLRQDPEFVQRVTDRWAELRKSVFAPENILKRVDEMAEELKEGQSRNFQRWPIIGDQINPNWFVGNSYDEEVSWMKNWIQERIAWIDSQFMATPTLSRRPGTNGVANAVSMRTSVGSVFYTVDGSDPRSPGGALSPKAREYRDPVSLEPGTKVFARSRNGDSWSGPTIGLVPSKKSQE